jgi:hypothetical protein
LRQLPAFVDDLTNEFFSRRDNESADVSLLRGQMIIMVLAGKLFDKRY